MNRARPVVGVLVLLVALVFTVRSAGNRLHAASEAATGQQAITAEQRAQGLSFVGVSPGHQQAVLAAIAAARPEAQRLIEIVDGRVALYVAPPAGGSLGLTDSVAASTATASPSTSTAPSSAMAGGISRLVLHELGHVIDHALLTDPVPHDARRRRPRGRRLRGGQLRRLRDTRGALRRDLRQVGDQRRRPQPLHRLQNPAAGVARNLGRAAGVGQLARAGLYLPSEQNSAHFA